MHTNKAPQPCAASLTENSMKNLILAGASLLAFTMKRQVATAQQK